MAIEQTKLQQKQLEGKDTEKVKAEQATYNAGMTKTAQSLTAQLRDVAQAFCVEVCGDALNVAGVDVESNLRGANKVYYLLAFRIAPSTTPPPPSPSFASSVPKSTTTSATTLASG